MGAFTSSRNKRQAEFQSSSPSGFEETDVAHVQIVNDDDADSGVAMADVEIQDINKSGELQNVILEYRKLDGKTEQNLGFQPCTCASAGMVSDSVDGKTLESVSLKQRPDRGLPLHIKLLHYVAEKIRRFNFHIKLQERERGLCQQLGAPPPKKEEDIPIEPFRPLTEEEMEMVDNAFANSSRRKVLVTHEKSNIIITGEVLRCLRPGQWLNDELTSGRIGYDYKSVRRWTTQKKLGYSLFECDKIFVPVHKEIHWCLAVINKKEAKFQYLDSLGGIDEQVMRVLAKYIVDEVKDKNGKDIDVTSWKQEYVKDLPKQKNGNDCGVFMIKYADFYSRDIGLCFKQEHMPYFRWRTAKEILRLKAD
ncbi:ubiquitin-like-specific protease ESD4 isoform X2 [Cynara cardunculus var. scolymus]|uniref:ubiquitin-like-specific protease ESD4 isoform X2 n=1 Tax=Cynara cardunculus var. scolymus TaxID=59895 RepID=UPI000D62E7F2|nr:ubiquitin-like-specific protease ESD4 isoform X2 [Cynara cardunculus var. scolymus]